MRFIEEICGLNYQTIQNQYSIVRTFPFSSQRKRMSCILTEKTICSEKETILFVKGAPEIILESCYKFHSLTDKVVDMTSELKQEIKNNIDIMNSLALRTIVLAYKNLDGSESN